MEPVSERDIEQVSAAWLATQAAGGFSDDWVERWQTRQCMDDNYMAMWRFVLKLCEGVADDSEIIGMIGAGPLWSMVNRWPDTAVGLIEAEVPTNPTLLKALSIILTDEPSARNRIDAILVRHRQE